jgi:hypothetical protein
LRAQAAPISFGRARMIDSPKMLDADSITVLESSHKLKILETTDAGLGQLASSERPDS